jgi:NADH-quinone oxidoreductase subunit N
MTSTMIRDLFQYSLSSYLPDLIVLGGALTLLLLELFTGKGATRDRFGLFTASCLGLALMALWAGNIEKGNFHLMLVSDHFSCLAKGILLLGALITVLFSLDYIRLAPYSGGEYYSLFLFALLGTMILASVNDGIMLFLGIEVMSISIYLLVGQNQRNILGKEAALKYFLMGAFASAFLLFGIAMIYGGTGTTNIAEIAVAIRTHQISNSAFLLLGIAFFTVGLGFKVAAVPFHMWAPDVYEGAPVPVTAFMSVAVKAAAFFVLIRMFPGAFSNLFRYWVPTLGTLAVLSILFGNLLAMMQENIKRMLAYSSIAHAGYLLLGLICGMKEGSAGILFYLLSYVLMNLGAFGVIILLSASGKERDQVGDYAGLHYRQPLLALVMAISLISLAGIPPTAGFFAKFYLFRAAVLSGHVGLVILAVIGSMISIYYYLRVVVLIYMREEGRSPFPVVETTMPVRLALAICGVGTLLLGIMPGKVMEILLQSITAIAG